LTKTILKKKIKQKKEEDDFEKKQKNEKKKNIRKVKAQFSTISILKNKFKKNN
jgi:hypothetical protein